jgi:hypothetical protein
LAIGVERAHLVVRTAPQGSLATEALPKGVDLVLWKRSVSDGVRKITEVIACPREYLSRLFDEVRAARFGGTVLFPVWAVAERGSGRLRGGATLAWPGGSVVMARGGFGLWVDEARAEGNPASGVEASLRGGLSYAVSKVPDGWSSGFKPSPPSPMVPVAALIVAGMVWGVVRWQWIEQRIESAEAQRVELAGLLQGSEGGCTVTHLARIAHQASRASDVHLDHLLFTPDGLTLVGRGAHISGVRAFASSLGGDPANTEPAGDDSAISFRVEVPLPCAR